MNRIGFNGLRSGSIKFIGNAASSGIIDNLFKNGEIGLFYDPSDFSTMFQNPASSIHVTDGGQPIGLLLDKSKDLKSLGNVMTDSGFSNQGSWLTSGNWAVGNGKAIGTAVSTGLYQGNKLIAGRLYKATLTVSLNSGSLNLPYDGYSSNVYQINSSGTYTRYFIATLTNAYAAIGVNFTGEISNLSIELIDGNSAKQINSTLCPLFQSPPSSIIFDGVDDKLTTIFASALTGCTVVRATINSGVQVLTNQNIAATYDDSTSHKGLLIINRALTTKELQQVTQLLSS